MLPKCPVCVGAVLLSLGIPQAAYSSLRTALVAVPAGVLGIATYRRWKGTRCHERNQEVLIALFIVPRHTVPGAWGRIAGAAYDIPGAGIASTVVTLFEYRVWGAPFPAGTRRRRV